MFSWLLVFVMCPIQVGIWQKSGRGPFCGGSLISPNFVLTAAHCMVEAKAAKLKVALNDVNYQVKHVL